MEISCHPTKDLVWFYGRLFYVLYMYIIKSYMTFILVLNF